MNISNKKAFSSIVALFMVWFLLILTSWVYNLVLKELFDNRSLWNYIKAYAWAQSAAELALLKIKEKGYGYYDNIEHNVNNRSVILSENPLDSSLYNSWKDALISYDLWTKVQSYVWELNTLWYDIIPLFYLDDSWEKKALKIKLDISEGNHTDLVWNIVWGSSWISWVWSFAHNTFWNKRSLNWNNLSFTNQNIESFLNSSIGNYLILFNWWNNNSIKYTIQTLDDSEYFSKPKTEIISSSEVGGYRQNLRIELDNTKYLNILKYSIYSN